MHVKHNETVKIIISSEIFKTIYYDGSYFLLFGNKDKLLKLPTNNFSFLESS